MARMTAAGLSCCVALVVGVGRVGASGGYAQARDREPGAIEVGKFSERQPGDELPDGWTPQSFSRIERHTEYSLVDDAGTVVVKAVSDRSASGLVRAMAISPMEYPFVEWRWKVGDVLSKANVASREGDDYPARLYITFTLAPQQMGYLERLKFEAARLIWGRDLPFRAISYVWGSSSPVGSMVPNAYTDRVMMFVVESGRGKSGQWVVERRNIYEDYRMAFGMEPPLISGVAIMTDTDNTGESAIAWYGDIAFRKEPSSTR